MRNSKKFFFKKCPTPITILDLDPRFFQKVSHSSSVFDQKTIKKWSNFRIKSKIFFINCPNSRSCGFT